MTKRRWFAGTAVLLFGIGVAGYATLDPLGAAEGGAAAGSERYEGTEAGSSASADSAAIALRESLTDTLKRSSKGLQEMPRQGAEKALEGNTSDGSVSSSRDAADRARKLFADVRRTRSISRKDLERLIELQGQMGESEVEETARQLQELLKMPNLDTSAL